MSPELIALRAATIDDARAVWAWRNEPAARAASFSSDPIPWEAHEPWFAARVDDPATRFLVAVEPDGRAVGYARFSLDGDDAEISVGLDPAVRGRGYGRIVIRAACRDVLAGNAGVARVVALIKPGNDASLRAFRGAGFAGAGRTEVGAGGSGGTPAVRLVLQRPAP